ncbi:hypothetical protein, partial [Anaerobacillus alkalidiazotrophicus]|uniref:hypothetical protein n=1 Tax=Anaerobacillus alkalidiazotrophicus TaxID=472963 RepID=UPI0038993B74
DLRVTLDLKAIPDLKDLRVTLDLKAIPDLKDLRVTLDLKATLDLRVTLDLKATLDLKVTLDLRATLDLRVTLDLKDLLVNQNNISKKLDTHSPKTMTACFLQNKKAGLCENAKSCFYLIKMD